MRFFSKTAAAALLSASVFAWAGPPDSATDRTFKLAETHLLKGNDQLQRVSQEKTNAARIDVLDRAIYFFRRARTVAANQAEPRFAELRSGTDARLVRALDDQAEIYYARKSLWLAEKRVKESLSILPNDPRSAALLEKITTAKNTDVYDQYGNVPLHQIRNRRFGTGVPLRDRGPGLRR